MLAIVGNLIEAVIAIKSNGFMQFDNIPVSSDKIFVNTNNYKVFLIYLPIYVGNSGDSHSIFENQLKDSVIEAISRYDAQDNPAIRQMTDAMRDRTVSIEELGSRIGEWIGRVSVEPESSSMADRIDRFLQADQGSQAQPDLFWEERQGGAPSGPKKKGLFGRLFKAEPPGWNGSGSLSMDESASDITEIVSDMKRNVTLTLVGCNTPQPCQIPVSKEIFVIGRNAEKADYAITFNKAVGREHCRLMLGREGWCVEDLSSSNGTFLNGSRLRPNQPALIRAGDMLRLADSDFRVQ